MPQNTNPLVSIISFCRNRAPMIRRSIESVLNQTYPNIEFVVQDGASTDGTLEILREYAAQDARIKLVSEPDSGPAEAFWKVLHRCQGDIIGTCLSDEELLPDAVKTAVERFSREPKLGAITGDGYISDENGKVTGDLIAGEFDFVGYLFSRYCPFWSGSFFRQQALIDVGLHEPGWNMDCIEFEIWRRLATDHEVKYFPGPISKYAVHPTQASNTPANFNEHVEGRLSVIEKMFSAEGFFGPDPILKLECMINQLFLYYNHARAYALKEQENTFGSRIKALEMKLALISPFGRHRSGQNPAVESLTAQILRRLRRFLPAAIKKRIPVGLKTRLFHIVEEAASLLLIGQLPYVEIRPLEGRFDYRWARLAAATPWSIRRLLPRPVKDAMRRAAARGFVVVRFLPAYLLWLVMRLRWGKPASSSSREIAAPRLPVHVYPIVARLYDARGQIDKALEMWRHAAALRDPIVDGLANQAMLKLPSVTDRELLDYHRRWASAHAIQIKDLGDLSPTPFDGRRKIKVAYHFSFVSNHIRFTIGKTVAAHDRSRFEIVGYTPEPLPKDLNSAFDSTRNTLSLSDRDFVNVVRGDQVDIFVELSGFSPGHRFTAMASRCAPIQISHFNHSGTSGTPNIDYIFSDEICVPQAANEDRYYSESVYRLPSCFLCFDYDFPGFNCPPVSAPPSLARKYVTFGCFGSGSKINDELIGWWAELLHRVPDSIFYIRNNELSTVDNRRFMFKRFSRFGIRPERLRIKGGTDPASIMREYSEIDISLDTWPYCGGNTIGESFWQGVPLVTYRGGRFSSRYGASQVLAAGCPELIGDSVEEYLTIATQLAGDSDRLINYRHKLRQMSKKYGLSDSTRYAKALEGAYADMMRMRWDLSA